LLIKVSADAVRNLAFRYNAFAKDSDWGQMDASSILLLNKAFSIG
jgi:hypothetical protein